MKQVTAAVIIEDGRLLIMRRAPGQSLAGMWELPGGKVEPGETPQMCLERELDEELGLQAHAGCLVAQTRYEYDHGAFEMLALATERLSDFSLRVHDAFDWVTPETVVNYALAPADVDLLEQILQDGAWAAR